MSPPSKAAVLLLALASACHRVPVYVPYAEPAGRWSMEVPKDWAVDADPAPGRKPAWTVKFIGAGRTPAEGAARGPMLSLTRLSRRRADFPGDDKAFREFDAASLKPARELFGDDGDDGEKRFDRRSDVRSQGAIYRTADAYFVMEYRASAEDFAEYHYGYERARLSFELKRK